MKNLISILLIAAGLILIFAFTGQSYNGCLLIFIALLIIFFEYASKKLQRIVSAILCIGILYFIIVEVPIIKNSFDNGEKSADYLIVLGAAVYGESPSLSMLERCDAAIEYLNDNPGCTAIVSGGRGSDEIVPEAKVMRRLLLDGGISDDRIIVEEKSSSTYENIKFSSSFIKNDASVAVCTSEYHIYRAKLIGKELGLDISGVPAKTQNISVRCNYFIREAFALTHQWIFE